MQFLSNSNPTVLFILEHHSAWLFHQSPEVLRCFLLLFHLFNWENCAYFWLKILFFINSLQGSFIFQWCFRLWFSYLALQYSLLCFFFFFPHALNGLLWCPPHIPSLNPSWIFDLHTMQQFTSGSERNGIH